MNSRHGVVLPVTMFCSHADTTVRAMSRTPTTTWSRSRPRLRANLRTCRGRAIPSSSSEISALGPEYAATSEASRGNAPGTTSWSSPCTR